MRPPSGDRLATRQSILVIDIFNATNEATGTARITQLGPTCERISGIQRGRLIKLGLNMEF
jgi:hypothetical protein